ncbi:TonB-dependent receptor, partial [Bacteroidales bacterium OttesenSCG-928-J19]|nr:TonB-dependent receptor [Bacteroidales bacterium OttesenSCG-928-J19]
WQNLKVMANLLASFVRDKKTYPVEKTAKRSEYSPAVYLAYKPLPDKDLTLRAFYKRIFRMPTFNELYYGDTPSFLKPEQATQYDLGVQWKTNPFPQLSIELGADAYYNEVRNKLIAVPNETTLARWTMMNLGKVKIRGLEASARAIYDSPRGIQWRLNLQYTYQKAQDYTYPEEKGEDRGTWKGQIHYIRWHSGSVVATALYRNWDVNYSFIYVGERYTNSANTPENRLQPWYTNDLSVGKSFAYKHYKLRLSAEVSNLFDQQYDVIVHYPMPGRNYRFTLRLEL